MLKKRTFWQALALITRVGLIILTLAAVLTSGLWAYGPVHVERLDKAIIKRTVRLSKRELNSIRTLAKSNQGEAKARYLEFLEANRAVRKGDLISDNVIQAMTDLSQIHAREGDLDAAITWAKARSEYDKNDLVAQVELIRLLLESSEFESAGVELLEVLYQRVPELEDGSRLYTEYLLSVGKRGAALAVAERFFERSVHSFKGDWRVFWDSGDGFNAGQSKPVRLEVSSDGQYRIDLELPSVVERVRVDPPPNSRLLLREAMFRTRPGSEYLSLAGLEVSSHDVSVSETGLLTGGGGDPYFYWTLPGGDEKPGTAFEFVASIENAYPAWATNLAQRAEVAKVRGLELKLYWAESRDSFSESKSQASRIEYLDNKGGTNFALNFAAGPQVKRLRLDFPDVENVSYRITTILLRGESGDVKVDLLSEKSVLEHQVDRDQDRFRVLGPDPHFALALKEEVAFHSVEVRGVVE